MLVGLPTVVGVRQTVMVCGVRGVEDEVETHPCWFRGSRNGYILNWSDDEKFDFLRTPAGSEM